MGELPWWGLAEHPCLNPISPANSWNMADWIENASAELLVIAPRSCAPSTTSWDNSRRVVRRLIKRFMVLSGMKQGRNKIEKPQRHKRYKEKICANLEAWYLMMTGSHLRICSVLCLTLCPLSLCSENSLAADDVKPEIRIGSKKFTESVILGEMLAYLTQDSGVTASHRR